MSADRPTEASSHPGRTRARVFDIRMVIGLLLGIYGVVLLVTGFVGTSENDLAKADDVNINLWAGMGLVLAAAVFALWARLRPLLVPLDSHSSNRDRTDL